MAEQPTQPASTAPLSKDTEHVLQSLARLIAQYVDKPRMEALTAIYAEQVQDLEDAWWELATERFVDTAVGVQLDILGVIVGQDRNGLDDDTYRALIRARIKANNSDGTIPAIYGVALAAAGGSWLIEYIPYYPASFVLQFDQALPFDESIVNRLIRDATLGGARSVTVFQMTDTNQIRFGRATDYPEFDVATGFDSATTPGTGLGQCGRAMDEQTA